MSRHLLSYLFIAIYCYGYKNLGEILITDKKSS